MEYSLRKGFTKGLKYGIIFVLPLLVNQFIIAYPQWAQLTVGGLLVVLVNWLKVRVGVRFL